MARRSKNKTGADISSAELLRALLNPNRSVELKYLLARQFNEMERLTAGLNDEKGSVILTDRNKVALKVLAHELATGKKEARDLLWRRALAGFGGAHDRENGLLT